MEGDELRLGSRPHDPSAKRRSSDSGLISSNQVQGESSSNSSINSTATPGVQNMEASTMLAAGPSSATRTGEIHDRRTRQRTSTSTAHGENSVSSAPTTPEQRGQQSGGLNADQQGSHLQGNPALNRGQIIIIPDSALQGPVPRVGDPRIRTRITSELRNLMRLQGRGGIIRYHSHFRVPGHWWLMGVVYQPDDDDEDGVDAMSYEELFALAESLGTVRERIRSVSTGLSEEVIMAKMEQRKYSRSTTSSPVDLELCCICQEEYADNDDIGKLDCRHEYHVACIKEWLAQKNSCPICKSTALAT